MPRNITKNDLYDIAEWLGRMELIIADGTRGHDKDFPPTIQAIESARKCLINIQVESQNIIARPRVHISTSKGHGLLLEVTYPKHHYVYHIAPSGQTTLGLVPQEEFRLPSLA